jgi:hypothetical protein
MKTITNKVYCGLAIFSLILCAFAIKPFPETSIGNGLIELKVSLPDPQTGYYRGTRFDWSGVVSELTFNGHSYFGQWFEQYDPTLHDAITGPVEEFSPLGYNEAVPGGSFVKIGVGILQRDDSSAYRFNKTYPILQGAKWESERKSSAIKFSHSLADHSGYAYTYTKKLEITKGKPELVLVHSLKNVGSKAIETDVYDHNFFMIDMQPTGPGIVIKFPFALAPENVLNPELVRFSGNQIRYLRALRKDEHVYSSNVKGFSEAVADYDIRIENEITGAGVRITSDHPLSKIVFWSSSTTSCPEPYIHLKVTPGETVKWKIFYTFYTFKPVK